MPAFEAKVSFITGAGSGLGRATALKLAAEGSTVVCSDINEQSAQATAARAEEMGAAAFANALDTANEEAVKEALAKTVRDLGRLDVLMNNAGVGGKDWATTNAINLDGVYFGLVHACPIMAAQGGGAIVNTSSVLGLHATNMPSGHQYTPENLEAHSAYVASKHGVIGLTKQFATVYAADGVRVNAICPGYIETPILDAARAAGRMDFLRALHPIGRLGRPEEVAEVASFLASDAASFVTGVAMPVDGGYSAQ